MRYVFVLSSGGCFRHLQIDWLLKKKLVTGKQVESVLRMWKPRIRSIFWRFQSNRSSLLLYIRIQTCQNRQRHIFQLIIETSQWRNQYQTSLSIKQQQPHILYNPTSICYLQPNSHIFCTTQLPDSVQPNRPEIADFADTFILFKTYLDSKLEHLKDQFSTGNDFDTLAKQ